MIEQFTTIEDFKEIRFKEKGSLFISQAFPVSEEEQALSILNSVRKEFYDATHHCYCFKLSDYFKYSDDGEPNGTAGIRILNAIDHFNLLNLLVVVIRYYGGVKLGVGPLGKAYYNGAHLVLEDIKTITKYNYEEISFTFSYDYISQVHQLLEKYEAKITKTDFNSNVILTSLIKPAFIEQIEKKVISFTKGSVIIKRENKNLFL
jgi:uncharacterized YigZ family protein